MRMKLLSAFLGILMIAGLIAPLMMVNNSNVYDEINPVEVMQFSDISNSWHDDCSNSTDWQHYTEWEGYTRWDTASGTLVSNSDAIHCPTNSGWETGPFWFKQFPAKVTREGFQRWDFELNVNQPSMRYKGSLWVGLFDNEKQPVFVMQFLSWDEWEHQLYIYLQYRKTNSTSITYERPMISNPNFSGVCSIYYEEGVGLMASIGNEGSGVLLTESEWNLEPSRLISYIGIQWRKGAGIYLDYFVNDINITGEFKEVISIDSPDDIIYPVNATGNILSWIPFSTIPDSFELFVNDELVDSGSWNGSVISVNVDGLVPGIHNYSIHVYNTAGESATDWVLVMVTGAGLMSVIEFLIISAGIGSIVIIIVVIAISIRHRSQSSDIASVSPSDYKW